MPLSEKGSVVGSWNISIPEGDYLIEFEHGSTSGKRVIWVNGKEIFRKDWMFRLIGPEIFRLGRFECQINVEPDGTFGFHYSLLVKGLPVEEFKEWCRKKYVYWNVSLANQNEHMVVFERDSMDVWLNGKPADTKVEFVEGGNLISFPINGSVATIKSTSSGKKRVGMVYNLILGDEVLQPMD